MFTDFFFLLRAQGLRVSLREWDTLLEGLRLGLHRSSLLGFYQLARAVLVHSEADFDRFDRAFLEYFKNVESVKEIPPELLDWLSTPIEGENPAKFDPALFGKDIEEIRRMFEERLKEQNERHDGGSHWIGTGGASPFGNSGYYPGGIRVGGQGRNRSAVQVAGERRYRDFRDDAVLGTRQFQMALRRLRQLSSMDEGPKDELKLDETIRETGDNAGRLTLVFGRPRRNTVKLLLLFDSGGSMWEFSTLCTSLFRAVSRSNKFKDLKIYYFHNCVYDYLYLTPQCSDSARVETSWVLDNLRGDYKTVVVGDASMAPYELLRPGGCSDYYTYNDEPGIEWLAKLRRRYERSIWLNPMARSKWEQGYGSETVRMIMKRFPMYPLTVKGLEEGMADLIRAR